MRRNEEGLKVSKLRPQSTDQRYLLVQNYIRVPLLGGFGLVAG